MAQSVTAEPQSHNVMDETMCLEEVDLTDVVAFLQTQFSTRNEEQQQDLRDLETGTLDFEALFLKYRNEDGSWKDDFENVHEHLQALTLSKLGSSSKQHQPAVDVATQDSDVRDSERKSCEGADRMDID